MTELSRPLPGDYEAQDEFFHQVCDDFDNWRTSTPKPPDLGEYRRQLLLKSLLHFAGNMVQREALEDFMGLTYPVDEEGAAEISMNDTVRDNLIPDVNEILPAPTKIGLVSSGFDRSNIFRRAENFQLYKENFRYFFDRLANLSSVFHIGTEEDPNLFERDYRSLFEQNPNPLYPQLDYILGKTTYGKDKSNYLKRRYHVQGLCRPLLLSYVFFTEQLENVIDEFSINLERETMPNGLKLTNTNKQKADMINALMYTFYSTYLAEIDLVGGVENFEDKLDRGFTSYTTLADSTSKFLKKLGEEDQPLCMDIVRSYPDFFKMVAQSKKEKSLSTSIRQGLGLLTFYFDNHLITPIGRNHPFARIFRELQIVQVSRLLKSSEDFTSEEIAKQRESHIKRGNRVKR